MTGREFIAATLIIGLVVGIVLYVLLFRHKGVRLLPFLLCGLVGSLSTMSYYALLSGKSADIPFWPLLSVVFGSALWVGGWSFLVYMAIKAGEGPLLEGEE